MTKHRHIYRQKRTAVFILLAAVLICAAVCRRSGGEKAEPEREKGLTAYVLRADTTIYMEFGVRNEFLRALHGGELSGELLLSARSGDTVVSGRRAYSTAEADQPETRIALETEPYPSDSDGSFLVTLEFADAEQGVKESISMTVKDFVVQLSRDSVKCVVDQMTNEEKARLVTGYNILTEHSEEIGGTTLAGAAGATAAIPRLGIPSIYFADGAAGVRISGQSTGYPSGTVLANSWNTELVEKVAASMGRDAAAFGIDVLLAPGANLQRDVLGGRNFEYFSEDPLLTGRIGAAYVRGLQSENVGAAVKHFAANNQESARGTVSAELTERALRELYLTGFERIVREAAPWTVMTSYNKLNGKYTSVREDLNTGILRNEWDFRGMVMTDWDASGGKTDLLLAQNDLSMPGKDADCRQIVSALERGRLDTALIDLCCENILNVVARSNTMRRLEGNGNIPDANGKPDLESGAQIAREAASEGIVLLKNEGALPFEKGEIALFGNGQIHTRTGGFGAGDINPPDTVSIAEGLEASAAFTLNDEIRSLYAYCGDNAIGIDRDENPKEDTQELVISSGTAMAASERSDCAVIVITRSTREGKDHRAGEGDFCLNQREADLIRVVSEAFHEAGKKVIVVINAGNPIEVASWRDSVDAILYAGLGGQEMGHAVADVISGAVNPSGKLTATFPLSYSDAPSYRNFPGNSEEVIYYEDLYVGYRFYETFGIDAAYSFGHGLSYTDFAYSEPSLSGSAEDGSLAVTVTVENTGAYRGKEIVQVYVKKPGTSQEQPALALAAFGKTKLLRPGESETLTLRIDDYALRTYLETVSDWILEEGEYRLYTAASVCDLRGELQFRVAERRVVQDVENRCAPTKERAVLTQAGGLPDTYGRENLALNKSASADVSEGIYIPEYAVDGDYVSRWSGFADSASPRHWLQIDLEQEYRIDEIRIVWESIGSSYTIELAGEDGGWNTAERVTDTSSLEHTVFPEGEKARYIRVQIGKQGFVSIFEIEVYGRE